MLTYNEVVFLGAKAPLELVRVLCMYRVSQKKGGLVNGAVFSQLQI